LIRIRTAEGRLVAQEIDDGEDVKVESATAEGPRLSGLPTPDGKGGVETAEGSEEQKPDLKKEVATDGELAPDTAAWAKDLGFTAEDLDGLTAEEVKRICTVEERRMKASAAPEKKTDTAEAVSKSETSRADTAKKFQKLEFAKEVREKFDPEVVGLLDQVNNHYAEHVEALMKRLDARDEADAQRQHQELSESFSRSIESTISELGKEYEPIFGKSGLKGMDKEQKANYQQVYNEALMMAAAYEGAGKEVDVNAIISRTIRGMFATPAAKAARTSLQNAIRDSKGRIVAVPTQRTMPVRGAETTKERESKAIANLNKRLQAKGVS
jgi:hypothetical protein